MPRTSAARSHKPVEIHPASTSRIEKASRELKGPGGEPTPHPDIVADLAAHILEYGVQPLISALTTHKDELNARLLTMTKHEGDPDEKGKIRYETEDHKFVIIKGRNVYIGEKDLRQAMTTNGIKPTLQEKILNKKVKKVTEYEYVSVTVKDHATNDDEN